jgi:hypothetical protein
MKKDSTRIAVADTSIPKLKNEGADVMLYSIDEILLLQAVFINSRSVSPLFTSCVLGFEIHPLVIYFYVFIFTKI